MLYLLSLVIAKGREALIPAMRPALLRMATLLRDIAEYGAIETQEKA